MLFNKISLLILLWGDHPRIQAVSGKSASYEAVALWGASCVITYSIHLLAGPSDRMLGEAVSTIESFHLFWSTDKQNQRIHCILYRQRQPEQ